MVMDFHLIVMNSDLEFLCSRGAYLDPPPVNAGLEWSDEEEFAWKYTSIAAFSDAEEYGGLVFLVFPNGRKMQVEKKEIFPDGY